MAACGGEGLRVTWGMPVLARAGHQRAVQPHERAQPGRARAPAGHGGLQLVPRPGCRHHLQRAELLLPLRCAPPGVCVRGHLGHAVPARLCTAVAVQREIQVAPNYEAAAGRHHGWHALALLPVLLTYGSHPAYGKEGVDASC